MEESKTNRPKNALRQMLRAIVRGEDGGVGQHLKLAELRVVLSLLDRADEAGEAYPSFETIAGDWKMDIANVKKAMKAVQQLTDERPAVVRTISHGGGRDESGKGVSARRKLVLPTITEVKSTTVKFTPVDAGNGGKSDLGTVVNFTNEGGLDLPPEEAREETKGKSPQPPPGAEVADHSQNEKHAYRIVTGLHRVATLNIGRSVGKVVGMLEHFPLADVEEAFRQANDPRKVGNPVSYAAEILSRQSHDRAQGKANGHSRNGRHAAHIPAVGDLPDFGG